MRVPESAVLTPGLLWGGRKDDLLSFLEQGGITQYHLYGSGRAALKEGLKTLGVGEGHNVLLPSYICEAAVAVLRELGVVPRFYEGTPDLHLGVSNLKKLIDARTKGIMVVNYFGFPHPEIGEVNKICQEYGLYLIEDNAHGFLSRKDSRLLGTIGDIGFASIWKILPTPNGGVLFINRKMLEFKLEASQPHALPWRWSSLEYLGGRFLSYLETFGFPAETIKERYMRAVAPEGRRNQDQNYGVLKAPILKLSLRIMERIDFEEVISRRRENYTFWLNWLGDEGVKIPFPRLPDEVCPWVFPVVVDDQSGSIEKMAKMKIPAAPWPYLPEEVEQNPDYPVANYLARHLVFLPVHQSLNNIVLRRKLS